MPRARTSSLDPVLWMLLGLLLPGNPVLGQAPPEEDHDLVEIGVIVGTHLAGDTSSSFELSLRGLLPVHLLEGAPAPDQPSSPIRRDRPGDRWLELDKEALWLESPSNREGRPWRSIARPEGFVQLLEWRPEGGALFQQRGRGGSFRLFYSYRKAKSLVPIPFQPSPHPDRHRAYLDEDGRNFFLLSSSPTAEGGWNHHLYSSACYRPGDWFPPPPGSLQDYFQPILAPGGGLADPGPLEMVHFRSPEVLLSGSEGRILYQLEELRAWTPTTLVEVARLPTEPEDGGSPPPGLTRWMGRGKNWWGYFQPHAPRGQAEIRWRSRKGAFDWVQRSLSLPPGFRIHDMTAGHSRDTAVLGAFEEQHERPWFALSLAHPRDPDTPGKPPRGRILIVRPEDGTTLAQWETEAPRRIQANQGNLLYQDSRTGVRVWRVATAPVKREPNRYTGPYYKERPFEINLPTWFRLMALLVLALVSGAFLGLVNLFVRGVNWILDRVRGPPPSTLDPSPHVSATPSRPDGAPPEDSPRPGEADSEGIEFLSLAPPPEVPRGDRIQVLASFLVFLGADTLLGRGLLTPANLSVIGSRCRKQVLPVWARLFQDSESGGFAWMAEQLEELPDLFPEKTRADLLAIARKGRGRRPVPVPTGALAQLWKLHLLYFCAVELAETESIPGESLGRLRGEVLTQAQEVLRQWRDGQEGAAPAPEEVRDHAQRILAELFDSGSIPRHHRDDLEAQLEKHVGLLLVREESTCRICGEVLSALPRVRCRRCRTPHHEECWEYVGGCSVFACGSRETTPDA